MNRQPDVRVRRIAGPRANQVCLTLAVVMLAGLGVVPLAAGQAVEGNSFKGRELFHAKGCSGCHAVWGHGGSLGPEITVAVAGKSWDELVGAFWNHTPRMMDEANRRGYPWPTLDPGEMADVLGYLYYLRLFDEPGDPVRGASTYARLQCANCHTLAGQGKGNGGPLDRFGTFPAPTPLAQAMWNAGPRMQQEQVRVGNPIPQFTGHEMADLQAYIRAEGRRSGREVELQPLPNPALGEKVYEAKRCGTCHGRGRRLGPDITRSALSKTASEITGLLWNHSYAMGAAMAAGGVPFPRFNGSELSDLIAYLYFRGYVGEDGNVTRGATLFTAKGCAACHKEGGGGDAPDVRTLLQRTARADLASAMWNHAPQMHDLMAAKGLFWPKFESSEMRDVVAYLRSLTPLPAKPKAGQ